MSPFRGYSLRREAYRIRTRDLPRDFAADALPAAPMPLA